MAGELIGGALLSAFLQVAFHRLASHDILGYFRGRKLNETLLKKMKITLLAINEVIDDAETKEIASPNVKAWVDEVKHAVFDAEDLLDEIDYEVSRSNQEAEVQSSSSKVWSFFTASVSSFDKEIESRMKQVLDNLEYLSSQKDILGLKQASGAAVELGRRVSDRLPSTSLVDEADIYGRDDDKEIVIKWLLSHNENEKPLSIISIVGMGGLGKTTLAQLVYNNDRMKDEFHLKAWVCVSEELDVIRVTKTILEAITLSTDDTRDLNMLQLRLKEKLSGKKFLLVLDDVWNENHSHWEALKTPFSAGAQGSRILVTTRSEKVALTMRSTKILQLKQLAEDDSWSLFSKHAFLDENPQSNLDLEDIGRKIVKKCKGLPLALKAIGSLLYTKVSFEEWNNILKSDIWDISTDESNILPALRLSYYYLPSHLKRCFAYCSLLPKDYEFEKRRLVELWNAENFLQGHQKNKRIKEIGDEYFHDLLSRSFFQPSSENRKYFVMHDLVSDLAKHVAGEFSLRLEAEETQTTSIRTRYFSYLCKCNYVQASRRFETIYKADKLRTFLPFNAYQYHGPCRTIRIIPRMVVENLLSRCKYLRVLSLLGYVNIVELPDSLGNLKHLRYLDLSYTSIKKVPDSLCLLFNLQTLKLKYCKDLEELPSDLHKLINLRHLDFYGTMVKKMPNELGKLKNLQVLSTFYVGECSKMDIKQLGELNLEGTLSILELQNVVQTTDALAANLKTKIHLEELSLEWCVNNDESQKERDVLENLQPHKNIKKLCIRGYGGTRFPMWLTDCSLSNLVFLELRNCKYCFLLPPLGILPSLKTLEVEELEGIVVIGPEFYGDSSQTIPFGSLEILKFDNMKNWEEWDCKTVSGAFSRLQELHIENCPMLKEHLPENLASLRKLVIRNCERSVASLPRSSDLKFLKVGGCSMDSALSEEIEYTMSNTHLEELKIDDWQNMELPLCHHCNFLRHVRIRRCNSLRSFPLDLFPSLQDLQLRDCSNLEMISISDGHGQNPSALKALGIWDCPKFVSFPQVRLSKLEWCYINGLDDLKALPECMATLLPSLLYLFIECCPQLESFREGSLPSNLRCLYINDCPKVTASRIKWGLHHHKFLHHITIRDADIQSFPDQGLLPPSLTSLSLNNCSNLTRLDNKGLCHLSSLKYLYLWNCPRLQCLPEEGLPSSLHTLEIFGDGPCYKNSAKRKKGKTGESCSHPLRPDEL